MLKLHLLYFNFFLISILNLEVYSSLCDENDSVDVVTYFILYCTSSYVFCYRETDFLFVLAVCLGNVMGLWLPFTSDVYLLKAAFIYGAV